LKPLLIAAVGRALAAVPFGRREDDIELRRVPALPVASTLDPERPTVVLLDRGLLHSIGADRDRLTDIGRVAAIVGIGDDGDVEPPAEFPVDLLASFIPANAAPATVRALLLGAFRHAVTLAAANGSAALAQTRYHELTELTRVGVALSTERDLQSLLELILNQARRISVADAGSVYLFERHNGSRTTLRFKAA